MPRTYRNRLNELDPKSWLKFQKSWFVHNPPRRRKDVLRHPAKFPEEIRAILGFDPPLPPSLAGLEAKKESFASMANDYPAFREFLKNRYS